MSAGEHEPGFTERLDEHPTFEPSKVKDASPRELGVRFIAGFITSVLAGAVALVFGPRAGGLFLAFPAILAASLTLIEEQEDSVEAREDARGAAVGGCALAAFAAVLALTVQHIAPVLSLICAAAAWALSAFGSYTLLWQR